MANSKSYEYGTGEAVVEPNVFTYMDFRYTTDNMEYNPLDIQATALGDFTSLMDAVPEPGRSEAMT